MRTTLILSGAALWVGVICLGAKEPEVAPRPEKEREQPASSQPATKTAKKPNAEPAEPEPVLKTAPVPRTPSEEAVRQASEGFVKAYGQGDAKVVAALFTPNAEYVDELNKVSLGRDAIEETFAEFFKSNPGRTLEMKIDSIRFVSPNVAIEDGTSKFAHAEGPASAEIRYSIVHVKTDDKWQMASVRDHVSHNRKQHHEQLQQLAWLEGDWVDEGDDSIVNFSCEAVDNGNFLVRKFSLLIAGKEAMSGTQRIGWDPLTGKLRAWIFDSEGGHAEGTWHRDGENWVLKATGVTADGQPASSTSIYTFVNEHTMTWQSVDHEIAGVELPDSEVVTIVRQAPSPMIAEEQK